MNNSKLSANGLFAAILYFASAAVTANAATIDNTNCMQEAANSPPHNLGTLTCTSDDVKIANTRNIEILENNCLIDGTGTVTFRADFELQSTASNRYNIGIYFATDNDSNNDGAMTGTCSISTLPTTGPVNPNDTCGDISSIALIENITLTASCSSLNVNGNLKLPYCTAWNNNDGATCSSPADAVPGNGSKCRCESGSDFQVPLPGAIQVNVATFEGDSTDFSYHLTGPNNFDQTRPATANSEAGADFIALPQGTYQLVQDTTAGWVLVNAHCHDGATEIPQNPDGSFDITILSGNVVICDFSNAFPIASIAIQNSLLSNADGDSSGTISVGDVLTISYAVTNTGNVALSDLVVTENNESVSELSCELAPDATLFEGMTTNCTATYKVTQADIDLGNIHVRSSVAAQANSGTISASGSFDITIAQVTLLTLSITPSFAQYQHIDNNIGYAYEVTNSGNTTITGPLSVNDDKNLVICPDTESLAPAASVVCVSTYLITANDLVNGSVTNTASALLGVVASNTADATITKLVITPVSTGGGGAGGGGGGGSSTQKPVPTQSSTSTPPAAVTPAVSSPSDDLVSAQVESSGCSCDMNATPLSNANWILMSLMLISYSAWRRPSRQRRN